MSIWIIVTLAAVVFMVLWLNGRRWRSKKYNLDVPSYTITSAASRDKSMTLFVLLDGAFNSSTNHLGRYVNELSRMGDVLEVEYRRERFNSLRTIHFLSMLVDNQVFIKKHKRIVVIGGSMGAILTLKLVSYIQETYGNRLDVSIIGQDAALGKVALPKTQRTLIRHINKVHPGPVWNFLLGWTRSLMLRGVPEETWEHGVDKQAVRRHIDAMRSFTLSAIVDMLAVIANAQRFEPDEFDFVRRVVYLRSETDEVLDGDAAQREWQRVFPTSEAIHVSRGMHLTIMEHPEAWSRALHEALELFELSPTGK